ncbi:MAG: carbohydrate kinase family protein [Thermoplasmata archaeon]
MRTPLDVIAVGNIVIDYQAGPLEDLPSWGTLTKLSRGPRPAIGGNGAIFAVAAARLGLRTALAGRVGRDSWGDWILSRLVEEGVETERVRRGRGGTATTIVLVRTDGERAFLHHIGAGASLKSRELQGLPRCRWLHISSMFLLPSLTSRGIERALRAAERMGAKTSLDVAWDPSGAWELGGCLTAADWFLPNLDEARAITGKKNVEEAAGALRDMGARNVAVKMGAEGALVLSEEAGLLRIPPFRVNAVDSTGAGDVFDAALVYGLLKGMPPARAALLASAAGAFSTTAVGGTAAAPSAAELIEFIRSCKRERG